MSDVKICSVNCRGLGEYRKRKDVFSFFRKLDCNIFLLQDVHCSQGKLDSFRNMWGTDILVAPHTHNSRGVAVLTKNIDLSFGEPCIDENGNYLIVKVVINKCFNIVIANVYGPNTDNPGFFEEVEKICFEKAGEDTPVLIAGDLNIALSGEFDTHNYIRQNNTGARDRVVKIMDDNSLVDVFREMNGNVKRYTWRVRKPILKQARLDYFLASDFLSAHITECTIVPGYRTDHSMLSLKLKVNDQIHGKGFFKFNTSLLKDPCYVNRVKQTIEQTVYQYALPVYSKEFMANHSSEVEVVINASLLWEVLILNIRTETIAYSIRKKSQMRKEEERLVERISGLETELNENGDSATFDELSRCKNKLEDSHRKSSEGLIVRSRARWYESGEKSTAYFLGLEKRNYASKIIPSLCVGTEKITKQNEIIERLVDHFRNVFRERPINEDEVELFFDRLKVKQISERQKVGLSQPLDIKVMGIALMKMKRNKSPGSDGFPAEFLKFFWGDLKLFFFRMVSDSLRKGELPLKLREGILTLLPKPNKSRDQIGSYRPITLLNCSYKILSGAVANRIKTVIESVIGSEQTAFIKGRFAGDNTRLTYDLLHYLKENKRSALFLSLDIEGAFNSVSWTFVRKSLKKRNFPENIVKWFDLLYVGSYARLLYNGHISDRICLQRSCRQGDPLSCYIFLIVMECLLEQIRDNHNIRGIKVKNVEYKLSCFADDTLCFLDGSVNSCRALFNDLGIFAKYSGLKPNIDKTEAFWAGAGVESRSPICENMHFRWVEKLKVLGVYYANDENKVFEDNFEKKLEEVRNITRQWRRRYLTIKGKILVTKTLLIPKFTHIFTSLPKPKDKFIQKLKQELFTFIWGGKADKIKRSSLYKPYEEGGLCMTEIESYIAALKVTWIRRHIMQTHTWEELVDNEMAKEGFIWDRNSRSLQRLACKITNPFWKETCRAYATVISGIEIQDSEIGRCNIWYSNKTKFTETANMQWKNRGLCIIDDLIQLTGEIMKYEHFKAKFKIKATYLDYLGLVRSLPRIWRVETEKKKEQRPVIHPYVSFVLQKKRGAKLFYNKIIGLKYRNNVNTWEQYWEDRVENINWGEVYTSLYKATPSVRLQILHYKIITRIAATNVLLHRMGIVETDKCMRCNIYRDTIEHRFWECDHVREFWRRVTGWINSLEVYDPIVLAKRNVLFGVKDSNLVNHVIIICKDIISKNGALDLYHVITRMKMEKETEECIAQWNGRVEECHGKWDAVCRSW